MVVPESDAVLVNLSVFNFFQKKNVAIKHCLNCKSVTTYNIKLVTKFSWYMTKPNCLANLISIEILRKLTESGNLSKIIPRTINTLGGPTKMTNANDITRIIFVVLAVLLDCLLSWKDTGKLILANIFLPSTSKLNLIIDFFWIVKYLLIINAFIYICTCFIFLWIFIKKINYFLHL